LIIIIINSTSMMHVGRDGALAGPFYP